MDIGSLCQRRVDTAHPDETAHAAAQRMASRCVGTLVVVDARERPIGIVTDRDLTLRVVAAGVDARATCLREVMTGHAETLPEDASIDEALAAMRGGGVRRLPIVGRDGSLVGIVSLDDVIAQLARDVAAVGSFLEQRSPERIATD